MTIIVKIGGSLMRGTAPRRLLARLAGEQGVVVVPGGGALADQVRAVQPQWDLSDAAAHRMALLAMEQMAHAMADLESRLLPARTPAELAEAAAKGAALWFPAAMTLGHAGIPESWDITSDSLAVWLAAEMGADRLVLVKAPGAPFLAPSGDRTADIAAWSATGLADAAFATMAVRFTGDILAVPADDGDRLDAALRTGARATELNEEAKEGSRPS
ncbi:aspartate kinase [Xanthobacter autotrophicus]|uniref:amino acid kinase family protein n=1 Tax=Xanthobacter autotrophicus TaxID=280 RepID=UPI00372AF1E9